MSWITRGVVAIAGLFSLGVGAWALLDPASFFARIALFPPYNQHFLHDVGAFQVGLGLSLLLALVWADALLVVLAANAVGATLHFGSHVVDRSLGGNPATDLPGLGLLALALIVAAAFRLGQLRRGS